MLVLDQFGTSIRARPRTGPLKFIRVSKNGRSVVCRSRLVAILPNPFLACTYQTGEAVSRCPPVQPQFWLVTMLVGFQRTAQGLCWGTTPSVACCTTPRSCQEGTNGSRSVRPHGCHHRGRARPGGR